MRVVLFVPQSSGCHCTSRPCQTTGVVGWLVQRCKIYVLLYGNGDDGEEDDDDGGIFAFQTLEGEPV